MITEEQVREALRGVMDPEIGRPIEDIGMLDSIHVDGGRVEVGVLLTIEGCPLKDRITHDVTAALQPLDGVEQVVTQTQSAIIGVATATGALLWKEALRTPYDQNAVTPVVHGGLVVYSGLNAPLRAGRPTKRGSGFVLEGVWSNAEVGCYMSTPVVLGGRIFGLSHKKKGQYFAVDAASGRTLWLSEGRAGENAAVLAGDGVLFFLDTDGTLTVAAADPSAFRPLRQWKVAASATWAHPVMMPDAVLVKEVDTLLLLRLR